MTTVTAASATSVLHSGADRAILRKRHELYAQARENNPRRWSGKTRNWTPVDVVTLNPELDSVVISDHLADMHIHNAAA